MASTHSKQAQLSPRVWDLLYNQLIHPPSPLDNSLGANFKPTPSIQDSELALPIVKHLNVSPSVSDFWPSFLWLPWWVCMIWFGPCSSLPVLTLLFHGSLHPEGHFERESISYKKFYKVCSPLGSQEQPWLSTVRHLLPLVLDNWQHSAYICMGRITSFL